MLKSALRTKHCVQENKFSICNNQISTSRYTYYIYIYMLVSMALQRKYTVHLDRTSKCTHFLLFIRTGKIKGGTGCNQAIMLVTDGVPYKFETIFQVISH